MGNFWTWQPFLVPYEIPSSARTPPPTPPPHPFHPFTTVSGWKSIRKWGRESSNGLALYFGYFKYYVNFSHPSYFRCYYFRYLYSRPLPLPELPTINSQFYFPCCCYRQTCYLSWIIQNFEINSQVCYPVSRLIFHPSPAFHLNTWLSIILFMTFFPFLLTPLPPVLAPHLLPRHIPTSLHLLSHYPSTSIIA